MNIYLPYVYKVTHKTTNQFYIGMRSANKDIAELDLGIHYFTSNKTVKSSFEDFTVQILAYFQDWESAFIFENETIKFYWGNPLLMNKHFQKDLHTFSMKGHKRPDVSERNSKTKSKPKEIRYFKCSFCNKDLTREEHCHRQPKEHYYCNATCRNRYSSTYRKSTKGIPRKGHPAWNKGIPGTGFGNLETNPMKNPESVQKMLDSRKKNKEVGVG